MSAIWSLLAQIVVAALGKLFEALRFKRQDEDRIDAHERAATSEAEVETQDVISEIAENRSKLPVGGNADDIAKRLRARRGGGDPGAGQTDAGD